MCVALLWSVQMWRAGFPVSQQEGYTIANGNRLHLCCAYIAVLTHFGLIKKLNLCVYKPDEFFVLTQRH